MSTAVFCGRCGGVKSGLIAGKVKLCDCGANANMTDVLAENAALRTELATALSCLKLIEEEGGGEPDFSESRDGEWCAEQAREVLKQLGEDAK